MNPMIKEVIAKHGLTVESVFIPFSQSRNAGEKYPSLNWKVTLKQNGRIVLSTDYMAGCAHAPSYKQMDNSVYTHNKVYAECEHGGPAMESQGRFIVPADKRGTIKPDSHDVIWSLLLDSEVLDFGSFEDWADTFGYDADSRSAEKTYNECMKIALKFRTIGESTIAELREVYQDY